MNIPGDWRSMQGLHAIEAGRVGVQEVLQKGWAHVINGARLEKYGESAEEISAGFLEYSKQKENEGIGILVFGLDEAILAGNE